MVQGNFFQSVLPFRHTQTFTPDITLEERKAWIADVMQSQLDHGIHIAVHERLDGTGYDFGFPTNEEKRVFMKNTFGEQFGEHEHTQTFRECTESQIQHWQILAESWLQENHFPYELKREGNEIIILFDRYSNSSYFMDEVNNRINPVAMAQHEVVYHDFRKG